MNIAMVYRGEEPHRAHQGFAEAVGADLLALDRISLFKKQLRHSVIEEVVNGVLLPSYDIYIAEGTRALYGAIANQLIADSKLIYLAGDQAIYKLTSDSHVLNSKLNKFISRYGIGVLKRLFQQHIDGVVAVSDFSANYTARVLPKKPIRVVNPYINPKLFEKLGEISPCLKSNRVVTVGSFDKYKGQDILISAWPAVVKKVPDAELLLVGADYPKSYNKNSGVDTLGYVENLPKTLSRASLYVQPSRVDNFPVSVLEAMRAGIPAIVTNTTGNKKEVVKINKNHVVDADEDQLADAITQYLSKSVVERHKLSYSARQIGSQYDAMSKRSEFKSQFRDLLSVI